MKTLLVVITLILTATGFGQSAVFSCPQKTFKFPTTNEGPVLEHYFVITNTGKAPLIITEAKVSCPCTKVTFPDTLAPGATDSIRVTFETEGKFYQQDRKIILFTNTKKKTEQLRFKVFVNPREEH